MYDAIQLYLEELENLKKGNLLSVRQPPLQPPPIYKDIRTINSAQSKPKITTIKPTFSINKSAGPITSIVVANDDDVDDDDYNDDDFNGKNNISSKFPPSNMPKTPYFSALIGSCTSSDPSYNRKGELVHLSLERSAAPKPKIICHTLNAAYSQTLRETISAITYSKRMKSFFTVDYGANLSIYNMHKRRQSSISSPIIGERLNTVGYWENSQHSLIGWGGTGGNLYLTMIEDTNDQTEHLTEAIPLGDPANHSSLRWPLRRRRRRRPLDKIEFHPVDPLALCMCTSFSNDDDDFRGGVGGSNSKSRVLSIDLKEMKRQTVHRSQHPLTAMNLDGCRQGRSLLLLGVQDTLQQQAAAAADAIEIHDYRLRERIASIQVPQRDIDILLWSPSGNLIASSETSDNSVFVHDFRFLGYNGGSSGAVGGYRSRPLLEIEGDPAAKVDSMMGLAWSTRSSSTTNNNTVGEILLSGGYTGRIRRDNLSTSTSTTEQELEVGEHINCITETENMLWAGCDSGCVVGFATNHKEIGALEIEDVY